MTKDEIEDYIDAVIKHSLSMVEYSNFFLTEIKGLAEDALDECNKKLLEYKNGFTKRKKKEVEADIQEILADLEARVEDFVSEQLIEIAENEEKYLHDVVEKALGVKLVIPAIAVGILSLVPIASAGSAEDFGANITDRLGRIYDSVINCGYTFAEDYEDILDDYEGQFGAFERGLDADSETLGYSLSDMYDRIVYTKNDKKIKGYIWSSMLDTSTCLACGSLDGTKYENISDVLMYPAHDRCRCKLIPYNEEIEDMIPESYSKWFEKQSDKDKYKILGKKRFELYEQGMKIKQFVNNGKITPLKDLKNQKD